MSRQVKYENRIVALVDILGFKNLVMDVGRCEEINSVLRAPYLLREGGFPKQLRLTGLQMTSISDSIVLSIKASERNAMNKVIRAVSALSLVLLSEYALLLRGGIAVGPLCHDDQVVYGPALVEAYEAESKLAVYPRVIISTEGLAASLRSCTPGSRQTNEEYFPTDQDGRRYLDIFALTSSETIRKCTAGLSSSKARTFAGKERETWTEADFRVYEKFAWLEEKLQAELQNRQESDNY